MHQPKDYRLSAIKIINAKILWVNTVKWKAFLKEKVLQNSTETERHQMQNIHTISCPLKQQVNGKL